MYQSFDSFIPVKISSSTLASRTNSFLHNIHSEAQSLKNQGNQLIQEEGFSAQEEDTYRKRDLHRYYSNLSQFLEKPNVLCEFCLASDHVSIECHMAESTNVWYPEKERLEKPTQASDKQVLCAFCRKPGHANCQQQTDQDDLFSNEDEKKVAIKKLNQLIYSNELWGTEDQPETISPTRVVDEDAIKVYSS